MSMRGHFNAAVAGTVHGAAFMTALLGSYIVTAALGGDEFDRAAAGLAITAIVGALPIARRIVRHIDNPSAAVPLSYIAGLAAAGTTVAYFGGPATNDYVKKYSQRGQPEHVKVFEDTAQASMPVAMIDDKQTSIPVYTPHAYIR